MAITLKGAGIAGLAAAVVGTAVTGGFNNPSAQATGETPARAHFVDEPDTHGPDAPATHEPDEPVT